MIDEPRWTFEYGFDPKMGEAIGGAMGGCEAILLGRTTYEMFEPAWSPRTAEEDPGAPFLNDTMKYVVSSTLEKATWRNSEDRRPVRPGRDPASSRTASPGGIYVSGSGTLVRAMLADGLVDELHLFVYPLTRGTGPRLFAGRRAPVSWRWPRAAPTTTASSISPTPPADASYPSISAMKIVTLPVAKLARSPTAACPSADAMPACSASRSSNVSSAMRW